MEENLEHSEWMKGIKETGFTTPSNYFEELNDSIRVKMAAERLRAAVPRDGHTVPPNYFEQLQSNILARTTGGATTSKQQTKIARLWRSNVLKYASAACFVIIAGMGVYFNTNEQRTIQNNSYTDAATEQMLFDIDEEMIIEHIEANYKDQQKPTAKETALENYILNNYSQNDLTTNL
ncbi:MAG TPA: hypothetical protein VK541_18665 [Pedobacter sp.]|uniref:hypothetical protein n=1 Tax=Pedobacter sp. TaxID=1411316 RepID=UPI002CF40A60|nr:hypothetical protein [Pedobacter sp.]HMI04520.1 hypothetical protein [Pedobacter sp.]